MKFKNIFKVLVVILFLGFTVLNLAQAEDEPINLETTLEVISEATTTDLSPVPSLEPEVKPESNFVIRINDTILWQGSTTLLPEGAITINDSTGMPHEINARSILATIKSIDDISDNFSISNLVYYDSFGSMYLKCILQSNSTEMCDNWQYAIGSTTPATGIDKTILSGGENIYIYFGPQNKILLDKNEATTADTVTITAEKYNYVNNTWENRPGVTISLTQPDPNNPWSPIEVQSGLVDTKGQIIFSGIPVGSYNAGVKEDFYFPTETLNISSPLPPPPQPLSGGGGGGVVMTPSPEVKKIEFKKTFDINKALEFLANSQGIDGSFANSNLYTDWVAIAYGASGTPSLSREKLLSYLKTHNNTSGVLTDNERRTMALLALGENPYDFNGKNYVKTILDTFDGKQFGDSSLINDDIFALILLPRVGFTNEDEILKKGIEFVLSKQKNNGSWEDSVDLTSATIQALKPHEQDLAVRDALLSGVNYLQGSQKDDGGWGNAYSSSWTVQALNLLNLSLLKDNTSGIDYLSKLQQADGGVLSLSESVENRIWATSYAVPAVLGKSWNSILIAVPKQIYAEKVLATTQMGGSLSTKEVPEGKAKIKKESIDKKTNPVKENLTVLEDNHTPLVATVLYSSMRVPFFIAIILFVLLIVVIFFTIKIRRR